jgi:uncharacterized membrane protein (DUF106 family)
VVSSDPEDSTAPPFSSVESCRLFLGKKMTATNRTLQKFEADLDAIEKIKEGLSDFQKCEYSTRARKHYFLNTKLASQREKLAGIQPEEALLKKHRRRELVILLCASVFIWFLVWVKVSSEVTGGILTLGGVLYFFWNDLTVRMVELELRLFRVNLQQDIEMVNILLSEINLGFIPCFEEYEELCKKYQNETDHKFTDLESITMARAKIEYERLMLSGMGIDVSWLYRL